MAGNISESLLFIYLLISDKRGYNVQRVRDSRVKFPKILALNNFQELFPTYSRNLLQTYESILGKLESQSYEIAKESIKFI